MYSRAPASILIVDQHQTKEVGGLIEFLLQLFDQIELDNDRYVRKRQIGQVFDNKGI